MEKWLTCCRFQGAKAGCDDEIQAISKEQSLYDTPFELAEENMQPSMLELIW